MSIKKPRGPSKSMYSEKWVSGTGQKLMVHSKAMCSGEPCTIHKPSNHHMVKWKLNWRQDRIMMERICEHGVEHPDPDDAEFRHKVYGDADTMHRCDGCCVKDKKKIVKTYKQECVVDDSGCLTWNDLAEEYNKKNGGRRAKTLPMEEVYQWACKQDCFVVQKDGSLVRKEA